MEQLTQAQFDALPKPDRDPVPYHFRLRGGGVEEQGITHIVNRTGTKAGVVVGGGDPCQLEGCNGVRLSVRWQDGKLTRPCTKGLLDTSLPGVMKIG